jgi:hypothetical protein
VIGDEQAVAPARDRRISSAESDSLFRFPLADQLEGGTNEAAVSRRNQQVSGCLEPCSVGAASIKTTSREEFAAMLSLRRFVLMLTGCVAATSAGYTGQPPDVVVSDNLENTAMGSFALSLLSGGDNNTAAGFTALNSNTTGSDNTAYGAATLYFNTTGTSNTATGSHALGVNGIGASNTATGAFALSNNTSGSDNTATGYATLYSNIGGNNTALGSQALYKNETGNDNTATGYQALYANIGGFSNAAFGVVALYNNTSGTRNAALGGGALLYNTTGSFNTAAGVEALLSNTTGSNNVAVGPAAGYRITTGSNNIEIANTGVAGDNGKIRIGTQGTQNATYIAGISGTHVTGAAVYVTSTGQLGVLASSERYKTAVEPMGRRSEKLGQLRAVTFHLRNQPHGDRQYGLLAEEVAKVYPELVIRNEAGQAEGVRYEELTPMLLNEVQQQQQELQELKQQVVDLQKLQQKTHH